MLFPFDNRSLCLASASPRRLDLLRQVGLEPLVRPGAVDESRRPGEAVRDYVTRMATDKAVSGVGADVDLSIGADTAVVLDGEILGKPTDAADARRMLARLSGREHRVITGVAVCGRTADRCRSRLVETRVWIKPLAPEEIAAYVATGEPMDKAGAYGIQGVGGFMVTRLEGSYSGVVGLPLFETLQLLRHVLRDSG